MSKNNEKTFNLGSILTITTGRLFTEMDNVYEILNFLSEESIYTHQIPKVMKIAQQYVLDKCPQLNGVGQDIVINSFDDAKKFLNSQEDILGNCFSLTPIPKNLLEHII